MEVKLWKWVGKSVDGTVPGTTGAEQTGSLVTQDNGSPVWVSLNAELKWGQFIQKCYSDLSCWKTSCSCTWLTSLVCHRCCCQTEFDFFFFIIWCQCWSPLIMKEQTRLGSQPGLFPGMCFFFFFQWLQIYQSVFSTCLTVVLPSAGMLKRTKYSRLRNDSLTSLEDHPQRMVPLKRDLCLDSDFAGTSSHCGPSTLGDYIPHVDNTQHQSPTCQQKSRLQPNTAGDKPARGHSDKPLDGNFSNCLIHPALLCTKRPITLHRMASLPCPSCSQHRDHLCCLKPSSATDDWTGDRAVHHHVKVLLPSDGHHAQQSSLPKMSHCSVPHESVLHCSASLLALRCKSVWRFTSCIGDSFEHIKHAECHSCPCVSLAIIFNFLSAFCFK